MAKKKWGKETILAALEDFKSSNGRYPLSTEMKGGNLPKHDVFKREFGFTYGRWLAEKGAERYSVMDNLFKDKDNQELIIWFKKISLERDYTSIYNHDYVKESTDPSLSFLEKRLSENELEELKYYVHCFNLQNKIEYIKSEFLRFYDEEKVPGIKQLPVSLQKMIIEHFLTYNNFLDWIGLGTRIVKQRKKSRQEMLIDYYNLYKKLGRTPTAGDFTKDMEPLHNYDVVFGGLNAVREQLGIPKNRDSRKYSKEYFIQRLTKIAEKEGGPVTIKVLEEKYGMVSSTVLKYFQTTSIKKVWEAVLNKNRNGDRNE